MFDKKQIEEICIRRANSGGYNTLSLSDGVDSFDDGVSTVSESNIFGVRLVKILVNTLTMITKLQMLSDES